MLLFRARRLTMKSTQPALKTRSRAAVSGFDEVHPLSLVLRFPLFQVARELFLSSLVSPSFSNLTLSDDAVGILQSHKSTFSQCLLDSVKRLALYTNSRIFGKCHLEFGFRHSRQIMLAS